MSNEKTCWVRLRVSDGVRHCGEPVSDDPRAEGMCADHLAKHDAAWCDAALRSHLPGRLL